MASPFTENYAEFSPDGRWLRPDEASFEAGLPTVLFQTRAARSPGYQYVVTADGSRFLINETLDL